jgi:lipopolysaccharide export LptBFGC system permease protein LptF
MLLNPTEVWLDAPPQPQHNKNNKMQLIVVWNNQGKQALNESNPAWLNNLKQTILEATWICNNTAHVLGNARVNARTSRKRNFNSYTQKLPFLLTSASGKCLITQTSTSTRAHTFQKYTTKNQSLKLTVVPYKTRPVTNK